MGVNRQRKTAFGRDGIRHRSEIKFKTVVESAHDSRRDENDDDTPTVSDFDYQKQNMLDNPGCANTIRKTNSPTESTSIASLRIPASRISDIKKSNKGWRHMRGANLEADLRRKILKLSKSTKALEKTNELLQSRHDKLSRATWKHSQYIDVHQVVLEEQAGREKRRIQEVQDLKNDRDHAKKTAADTERDCVTLLKQITMLERRLVGLERAEDARNGGGEVVGAGEPIRQHSYRDQVRQSAGIVAFGVCVSW